MLFQKQEYPKRTRTKTIAPRFVLSTRAHSKDPHLRVLTAKADINEVATTVIIDTGSEQNIICKDQATSIDTQQMAHLLAVGNTRVSTLGQTTIRLQLANLTISCTAVVVEKLPIPLIVGMRTLTDLKAVIDLRTHELRLHSNGKQHTVTLNSTNQMSKMTNCLSVVQMPTEAANYRDMYHRECKIHIEQANI